jgi:hypothetical protein
MTKSISVPAITAVANPLDFGTVASLSGWDINFPAADVTYTLSVDGGTPVLNTTSTSVSASGLSNGLHTITQTFYYKGSPVTGGNRNVEVTVAFNTFATVTGSILTLTLSKNEL